MIPSESISLELALIEKAKKGDRISQFELYERYYKAMYNCALRILKNETDAEDCMQEAFLKAFKSLKSFDSNQSFGGWIKRIVINECIDDLKSRKTIDFEKVIEVHYKTNKTNENQLKLEIHKIKQAMTELPDGYRTILSLLLFEGYDHEEIAQILKIKSSTSRSQFQRAKEKLIEIFKFKTN